MSLKNEKEEANLVINHLKRLYEIIMIPCEGIMKCYEGFRKKIGGREYEVYRDIRRIVKRDGNKNCLVDERGNIYPINAIPRDSVLNSLVDCFNTMVDVYADGAANGSGLPLSLKEKDLEALLYALLLVSSQDPTLTRQISEQYTETLNQYENQ